VDVGHPGEQLAQQDGDLSPGQVRAEAEVRSRAAEPDVRVGRAGDVEGVRIAELNTSGLGLAARIWSCRVSA
jgi:hypothetical protein